MRLLLRFLLLWPWLQQISRKANKGTYNCCSCSIAQALFRTGMKVLEDFHSINIFIRSTMLFKSWIIMLFIKSLIVFCGLPLVLFLFTLHMSFCLYLYKGKSNNKNTTIIYKCLQLDNIGARFYRLVVLHFCTVLLVCLRCFLQLYLCQILA